MGKKDKPKNIFCTTKGIVGVYVIIGVLWLALREYGFSAIRSNRELISLVKTYEGWFFIAVSAILLHELIRRLISKQSYKETDLERMEARLRHNERLLQETGRMAKIGGWDFDPLSRKNTWTDAIYEIFEIDEPWNKVPDDIYGFFKKKSEEKLKKAFREALKFGKAYDLELEIVTAKGNAKWIRSKGQPEIKDGRTIRIWGSFQDITDSVEAREILRQSEERYRMVLDNTGEVYFEVDLAGNFTYLSQYAMDRFVQNEEPNVERQSRAYIPPVDAEKITQAFNYIYRTGKSLSNFEYEGRLFVGEDRTFQLSAALLKDLAGNPVGFHGLSRDVTEKRRADKENENLKNQLHQAQKMESVGRLAGGVAHDFNNLLSVILGYSELIQEELTKDHPHYESITSIHSAALRAKNLTRQLLAFSRKQILEMKPLDINDVIKNFEKLIKRVIGEDIELDLMLLPQPLPVHADTAQLEQVLMNLSVNARDAMPDGGKMTLETGLVHLDETYTHDKPGVQPGRYAMVAISDTGSGMNRETMDNIFEPFFTTKSQDQGTGLGLATSYGIVKQHGGNIWVYSELGKGTTFKIYLPIYTGEIKSSEEPVADSKDIVQGAETILIVEDDVTVRKMSSKILSDRGYKVIETDNVEDALEKADNYQQPIHLLLTDVIMPGMKGPELKEKIEQKHPEIKVLYMSGYTDNVIVRHGVLMEGVQFIQKPFTINGLLEKITHVLMQT